MRTDDYFLMSREWRTVRMRVLERDGGKCACCGATAATGAKINVDHIKPRIRYPELALDIDNLQVLCDACNHGKGNKYETRWNRRPNTYVSRHEVEGEKKELADLEADLLANGYGYLGFNFFYDSKACMLSVCRQDGYGTVNDPPEKVVELIHKHISQYEINGTVWHGRDLTTPADQEENEGAVWKQRASGI